MSAAGNCQALTVMALCASAALWPLRAVAQCGGADHEIVLKRAWANKYANLTSISGTMHVRHVKSGPNQIGSGGLDGDIHFSGESDDVGLPFVAEIVNARLPAEHPAIVLAQSKEKNGQPVQVSGAWRLWFEHPPKKQTQGGSNAFSPNTTNPDHSFEIHPVTHVDQDDVGDSFVMIQGYTAYTADKAFPYYDQCKLTIKASQSGITLRSKKVALNYVEFDIVLADNPKKVSDGYIVPATIGKSEEENIATGPRRMIFVGGTKVADKIKNASAGDQFRVLGVPRIDLSKVVALVNQNGTKQLNNVPLPYEMIIVGVR